MTSFIVSIPLDRVQSGLRTIPGLLRAKLATLIQRLAIKLQTHVKADKLTGQVLNVLTGTLRRSINQQVKVGARSIIASVGTNVSYAAIHEYGGVIPAHAVFPVNALALRFRPAGAAEFIFRKSAYIPDVVMPERSFLRSSLADMTGEIEAEIRATAQEAMRGVL